GDGSIGGQIGVVGGYPTGTPLASDGDVKLTFNKQASSPTTAKIIVTGVNSGTAWNLIDIQCPQESSQPTLYALDLKYDASSEISSCSSIASTFYGDSDIFGTCSVLYSDSVGSTNAPAGYYSQDSFGSCYWRYWNGSEFTSSGGIY
ncbi:MAG: hypothetical protein ACO393_06160, partial [Methylophilaceae bacterium]